MASEAGPLVAVVMGSRSDEETMAGCGETLQRLGIPFEQHVMSAHRTPDKVADFARSAKGRGVKVMIAAAGGAAALPGVVAAYTPLPVIGVPLPSSALGGIDALHSIVQMPPGVPVACVSVGAWGARNAAVLAAEIIALSEPAVAEAVDRFREEQRNR